MQVVAAAMVALNELPSAPPVGLTLVTINRTWRGFVWALGGEGEGGPNKMSVGGGWLALNIWAPAHPARTS